MPVTAKLSKRFYEVLGDQIANELADWFNQVDATYRLDLQTLNEANFTRYRAMFERLSQFEASIARELAGNSVRLDRLEARLDRVEARLDRVEERLDRVEARLDRVEERLTRVESAVDLLRAHIDAKINESEARTQRHLNRLETRLVRLKLLVWVPTTVGILGLFFR